MGKIETYLGFAIKSNKIIYGLDNIVQYKKAIKLFVLCNTASANLEKESIFYANKKCVKIIKTEQKLETLINKINCKLVAILDRNLADAIIKCNGGNCLGDTRKQSK